MLRYGRWIVGAVIVVALGTDGASAQTTCDRACLRTMLDQYLTAVVKHDPAAAPLVVGFRQTENAINVRPGNGVWKMVTGLGKVQRRYFDATSGQAAYYGTVEEGSATAIVTVRVRVENKQLTEAEWYIARADDPGLGGPRQPGRPPANLHNPDYLARNPPPERVVPANQRSDRATLVRIVVRGESESSTKALAGEIATRLRAKGTEAMRVLGPAAAPMAKLRGQYRYQIQLQSVDGELLRGVVRAVTDEVKPPEGLIWTVDVDPWDMM